jgi:hypothetical protein
MCRHEAFAREFQEEFATRIAGGVRSTRDSLFSFVCVYMLRLFRRVNATFFARKRYSYATVFRSEQRSLLSE